MLLKKMLLGLFGGYLSFGLGFGSVRAADNVNLDWANLKAYSNDNMTLIKSANHQDRIVFMGDSITEFWSKKAPEQFLNKPYINRGISGQTAPQMLLRFRSDVINLQPKIVIILAGTNDIAGNSGPESNEVIAGYIASMSELAKLHNIKVVLSSLLPAQAYYWIPEIKPIERIAALNKWIKDYANNNNLIYIDYYTPMVDENRGLKKEYSEDGVHPNAAGYTVMMHLAEKAISDARNAE
jgi:lysophospholipase L1-like esterase